MTRWTGFAIALRSRRGAYGFVVRLRSWLCSSRLAVPPTMVTAAQQRRVPAHTSPRLPQRLRSPRRPSTARWASTTVRAPVPAATAAPVLHVLVAVREGRVELRLARTTRQGAPRTGTAEEPSRRSREVLIARGIRTAMGSRTLPTTVSRRRTLTRLTRTTTGVETPATMMTWTTARSPNSRLRAGPRPRRAAPTSSRYRTRFRRPRDSRRGARRTSRHGRLRILRSGRVRFGPVARSALSRWRPGVCRAEQCVPDLRGASGGVGPVAADA